METCEVIVLSVQVPGFSLCQAVYLVSPGEVDEALQHRGTESVHHVDSQLLIALKEETSVEKY